MGLNALFSLLLLTCLLFSRVKRSKLMSHWSLHRSCPFSKVMWRTIAMLFSISLILSLYFSVTSSSSVIVRLIEALFEAHGSRLEEQLMHSKRNNPMQPWSGLQAWLFVNTIQFRILFKKQRVNHEKTITMSTCPTLYR